MWKKEPGSPSCDNSVRRLLLPMPALPSTDTLEISVHDAAQHLNASKPDPETPPVLWIDCREQDEHAICHVEGATLVPLSNFVTAMEQAVPEDKNIPMIVYCHHGMRSLQATHFLRQKGHSNVWSMAGGIDLWAQEIDSKVPRY